MRGNKGIKMRNITSQEAEEVLKVLESKPIKLAYLWTVAIVAVFGFQICKVLLQQQEGMAMQILFYVILMLGVGVTPSIWENWREKYRIRCLKQKKAQCVGARCVYRSKQNESTNKRCTYNIVTEFGENRKILYKGRVGKSIETGDAFYVLLIGRTDFFFVRA